ncbi:SRPBCC family protein [Microlunatus ginsengisoli]|uniref:SRPBCC family protein n=1 Tax=Microlunatus ginsengisoli TaxID=363863 RepID=A0ABP6ZQZ2_9ACTN
MSVADLVGAVQRRVETAQRDGREAKVALALRTYDAAIEDVWDALTNPERIPRWFLPVSGDLTVGGRYQLEGNAGGVVERCDRPHLAAVTWEFMGEVTWLELRLTEDGEDRTELELRHTAFVDPDRWAQFGPGAVGVGWDLALNGLDQHLRTGATLDPAEFEAWSLSPEGMQFIAGASKGWSQAAIADGDDPAAAHEAGARTTAFYTGQPVGD